MRAKVKELEEQVFTLEEASAMKEEGEGKAAAAAAEAPSGPALLDALPPEGLLDELQKRIAKEQEAASQESEKWAKRLMELVSGHSIWLVC